MIDPVYISAAVLIVNVGGIVFAVGAWKKQTEQVSDKLAALETAVGRRLDKLERGLEETSSALALRVSNVENNLLPGLRVEGRAHRPQGRLDALDREARGDADRHHRAGDGEVLAFPGRGTTVRGSKAFSEMSIHRRPAPEKVAKLCRTHGWDACRERWWYIQPCTLLTIRQQGEKVAA